MRILSYACVQSSTDPNAKIYNIKVSFNTIRADTGLPRVKAPQRKRHITKTILDAYPCYDKHSNLAPED